MDYEYKLRKSDFIPMVGLINHYSRCTKEMFRKKLVGNDNYAANAWARSSLLSIYNTGLLVGAAFAAKGLVELLSK